MIPGVPIDLSPATPDPSAPLAAATPAARVAEHTLSALGVFHSYVWVFLVSFGVALCATPLMRRLAVRHGIVDRPNEARKQHKMPIAYLGGAAVFLGVIAGIFFSYLGDPDPTLGDLAITRFGEPLQAVPFSIVLGMVVIAIVGLIDDVAGTTPRVKIGGQLFAAAALAFDNVGVKLAAGLLVPIADALGLPITTISDPFIGTDFRTLIYFIPLPIEVMGYSQIPIDIVYWVGTALIAFFVIGACNASNLIDGLDGLLSGVTAVATAGLLVVALALAVMGDGPRDGQRIVLCMAVLGACLGFLPHNFNPASIFLGDCGSLLLGYCTIVIILTLGDTGKTHLVAAGLIIYSIPLIDTALAIVRRKMAGKSISSADSDHLHHMLKRALGVKGAALSLYGFGAAFAALGVLMTFWRQRVVYAITAVLLSYIAVIAIKVARKKQIEEQALALDAPPSSPPPEAAPPVAVPETQGRTAAAGGVST